MSKEEILEIILEMQCNYKEILKEHNDKINEIIGEINKMKKTKKQKIKEFIIKSIIIVFTTICTLDFITAIMIKLYC